MSGTEIQASVLHGIKDLRVEPRDLPPPSQDELQIRIASTGLCGSDLHYYSHFRNGDILVQEPLSLGHESAGIITAVGSNVASSSFSIGDKVALEVGVPCDSCDRCAQGRYNICKSMRFRSSGKSFPHYQGTLQQRLNHPSKWCHKLPPDLSLDVGALLEPLGVALHAFRRSHMPEDGGGASVLVFGAGAVGLFDLHYYSYFRNGDILVQEPLSLGHESAGIITAVGSNVASSSFSIGDKVALEVGVPCDSCDRCAQGRYNICKSMRFRSSGKSFPHYQGTLQQRLNHPSKWCHKLPPDLSLDVGALLEPLGVALHAFRRSHMPEDGGGASVLVFGAGAVGLLCAAVAKLKGARQVIIADIDAGRVAFAVANGFAHHSFTVPMRRGNDIDESLEIARETAAAITAVAGIGEVDVVFECTGVPSCVQAGIFSTKAGGRLMLVGMGHPVQTLPLGAAALREVDIVGVFRYADTYPESIAIVQQAMRSNDGPDFAKLVTHRFQGLAQAGQAFEMAGRTKDDSGRLVLKVVIDTDCEDVRKSAHSYVNVKPSSQIWLKSGVSCVMLLIMQACTLTLVQKLTTAAKRRLDVNDRPRAVEAEPQKSRLHPLKRHFVYTA
nr:sorbitol dehydrogenase [Quercus suber]